MKRTSLTIAGLILVAGFTACSDSANNSTTNDSTNRGDSNNANTMSTNPADNTANNNNTTTNKMPLSKDDSTFVMKAAMGGMMEVDCGNTAQLNAASDRVKAFGQMMVTDHSKANSDLMSLASSRGMTLPTDLPADMKKHTEDMKKYTGKSFDSHYMSMMVNDHKKDIAEFEKASKSSDADIKAFADRTLPTLRMHLDSAQAISKMKM